MTIPGVAVNTAEEAIRARLGIPCDARRVLVFTESSHWDPDWLLTSDQYFRLGVRRTLDRVLAELENDPRRVWSADCVFFLAMYWDRSPANRERLAALVNSGRLRLTSSGVTTQDTLVPGTEAILRDFLLGQEWLRSRGMDQEPRLAYFPDSFGHSPALPSLLRAAGFDQAVVTRIDGSYFIGSDWELPGRFPREGSSAELLTAQRSADFRWRDRSGAEVLAHWHPFTYGQGDTLASMGPIRFMNAPTTIPDRAEGRVAARIERYAAKLEPLARTPYLLCPIGLDFVNPIRDLLGLLDRYNEQRYPDTGLWVLNAGADDYLDLVASSGVDLPVLEFDPNPYWTGFYASRPELKRSHRRLVDELLATETEAAAAGPWVAAATAAALAEPWWRAVTGNHHDFITGTAPDRVTRGEQEPWLSSALLTVGRVSAGLPPAATDVSAQGDAAPTGPAVVHRWEEGRLVVTTGPLTATIDPEQGGCITELVVAGRTVLVGRGADLVAYEDTGGLWRIGSEYRGGHLRPVGRSSDQRAQITVEDSQAGAVKVHVSVDLDGRPSRRCYRFDPGSSHLVVDTRTAARERRTITLALPTGAATRTLTMDQPGGIVTRPAVRHFDPTFWPASTWLTIDGGVDGEAPALALAVEMTRAIATRPDGTAEVIVARNATKERAWRIVPILACPAKGHEPGETTATVALWWPPTGAPADLARTARRLVPSPGRDRLEAAVARVVRVLGATEGAAPSVDIVAAKPATRGEGMVIRLVDRSAGGSARISLRTEVPLIRATLCDVRERDVAELETVACGHGSEVSVVLAGAISSVRLVPAEWAAT